MKHPNLGVHQTGSSSVGRILRWRVAHLNASANAECRISAAQRSFHSHSYLPLLWDVCLGKGPPHLSRRHEPHDASASRAFERSQVVAIGYRDNLNRMSFNLASETTRLSTHGLSPSDELRVSNLYDSLPCEGALRRRARPPFTPAGATLNAPAQGGQDAAFLGRGHRSIVRSASATASDLVAAWPVRGFASIETAHFHNCRPIP